MRPLLLAVLLLSACCFSAVSAATVTKDAACRSSNGIYSTPISVKWPGKQADSLGYHKSGNLLSYAVNIWVTEGINQDRIAYRMAESSYLFEYNCSTKKARQVSEVNLLSSPGAFNNSVRILAKKNRSYVFLEEMAGSDRAAYGIFLAKNHTVLRKKDVFALTKNCGEGQAILSITLASETRAWVRCGDFLEEESVTSEMVDLAGRAKPATLSLPSESFKLENGRVKYRAYLNGVGRYELFDTDIHAETAVSLGGVAGKDKNGVFAGICRLSSDTRILPIQTGNDTYWADPVEDNVFVISDCRFVPLAGVSRSRFQILAKSRSLSAADSHCRARSGFEYLSYDAYDGTYCYGRSGGVAADIYSIGERK